MRSIVLYFLLLIYSSVTFGQVVDIMARPIQSERERSFDAIHYRIELVFDLDTKTFSGSNTIDLIPLQSDFSRVWLDATEIIITGAEDESGGSLEFNQDSLGVTINLADKYMADQELSIKVYYKGVNPADGLKFHEGTDIYPRMVESNSWPDHARYWYPCYDYPNDKTTQEVIVTVAKPYSVVSNGELVSLIDNGKTRTYHWLQDKPHSTYLSMLSIAPFSILNDSLDSLPVNYWVFSGDEENARRVFSGTPEIIEFYNRIFGYKYPWAKYDQVIGPTQGGGAEATSATILGLGVIHDADEVKDNNWKRIIAHEIAHQWWGDLVTLRTWSETWINEGFGTYSDYLYTEYFRGATEAALDLEGKKSSYLSEAANRYQRPIVFDRYNSPQENFDRHTYQKAATVLHMMRSLIGDEPFFRTLSHFLHKHEFGVADTHDFIISVKEATGKNLDWFFDQWIYRAGHPVFEISKSWDSEAGRLTFSVEQLQDSLYGTTIFRVPVTIGFYYEGGETIFRDVWIQNKCEQYNWELDHMPDMVRFDVGNVLLKEWNYGKPFDELVFQLENDDPIGRRWAVGELAGMADSSRKTEITSLLEKRASDDPVWAVRLASLENLAKINGTIKAEVLSKALNDKDQRVRDAAKKFDNRP